MDMERMKKELKVIRSQVLGVGLTLDTMGIDNEAEVLLEVLSRIDGLVAYLDDEEFMNREVAR